MLTALSSIVGFNVTFSAVITIIHCITGDKEAVLKISEKKQTIKGIHLELSTCFSATFASFLQYKQSETQKNHSFPPFAISSFHSIHGDYIGQKNVYEVCTIVRCSPDYLSQHIYACDCWKKLNLRFYTRSTLQNNKNDHELLGRIMKVKWVNGCKMLHLK